MNTGLLEILAAIGGLINVGAIIWFAAKIDSSVDNLKDSVNSLEGFKESFKNTVHKEFREQNERIAKIDVRVSLLEQESERLSPPTRENE